MVKYASNLAFTQGASVLRLGAAANRQTEHGYAGIQAVLSGGIDDTYVGFGDDFLGDTLKAEWQTDLSTGASVTLDGATAAGIATVSTDTDDDDHATLAVGLHWLVSKGLTVFSTRLTCLTAITLRDVEVGLSDAVSETNGLAFSAVATPTAVATNAAVMAINSDDSVTAWKALSVNAGGTPQGTTTAITAVAGTYNALKVVINAAGTAYFYVDGVLKVTHTAAVATTALLTPWISLKSLSGAIKTIYVDSASIYGTR